MSQMLELLSRRLFTDRRLHRRHRHKYDAVIENSQGGTVFRGRVTDLSRGGAKIYGLPVGTGVEENQKVRVGFLLLPDDPGEAAQQATFPAWVCRIEEDEKGVTVAVKFELPLKD